MKEFYFVLMNDTKGWASYDTFCGSFETKEEAIAHAEWEWRHLTTREQSKRIVKACAAEVEDGTPIEDDYDTFDICGGWDVIAEYTMA